MAEKQQLSDADLQQLLKALQKHGPQSEAARLVFQGLTLGFSDEIEALVRAPFDSREYAEIRDDIRGKISAHRERDPLGAAAWEVGGAMIPAIATLGASAPLSGASAAKTLGTLAKIGATEGAIAGIGHSEREGVKSAIDAPFGATIGAVTGPAGHMVGKYSGVLMDKFLEWMRQRGSEKMGTVVENEINRLADQMGVSRDEIIARVAAGETMSDDPRLHMAIRSYMSKGGGAEALVRTKVPERAAAKRQAGKEAVQEGLTGRLDANVMQHARMSQKEWQDAESAAYNQIFDATRDQAVPQELGMAALQAAQRIPNVVSELNDIYAIKNLVPLFKTDPNGAVTLARAPNLEDTEIIRRLVADKSKGAFQGGQGTLGKSLSEYEEILRGQIDKVSPELANTRAGWSAMSKTRDAFDQGLKLLTGKVEAAEIAAQKIMQEGSPAEIAALREGMMSEINHKLSIGGGKQLMGKLANPETREGRMLANVFPGESYDQVVTKLQQAGKAQVAEEKIVHGSTTMLAQEAAKQQGADIGMDELLQATYLNPQAVASVGTKLVKSLTPDLTDDQRMKVLNVLLSEEPDIVRNALQDSGTMAKLQQRVRTLADAASRGLGRAGAEMGGLAGQEASQGLFGDPTANWNQ